MLHNFKSHERLVASNYLVRKQIFLYPHVWIVLMNRNTHLWCIFVGSKPFESENVSELINKIIHVELPPPAVKGSRLSAKPSPDLVDLLNGLLHKGPGDRYVNSTSLLLCTRLWI